MPRSRSAGAWARVVGGWVVATLLWSGASAASAAPDPPPATAASATAVLDPSPEEVRRATEEVLSRRAYASVEPSPWRRAADDVRRWLAGRLLAVLGAASVSAVAWSIVALGCLVAAVIAWRLLRGTRWEPSTSAAVVGRERRSAAEWDARSREAERRGDLREAIRSAYRAVLMRYAEAGRIDEVPGRTVGEYRADVARAAPEGAPAFSAASDVVEAVLYAGREPSPDDLAVVRRAGPRPVGVGA